MFSKDLEVSIANLFDKAQEINIQYLTVEHLFLMILNDYDVKDFIEAQNVSCLLYTSPSPRDKRQSRMPSSA